MIGFLLPGYVYESFYFGASFDLLHLWVPGQFILPLICLVFVGIFILIVLLIIFLLKEFEKGSTKRCPYCEKRIPTDAAWCKFCKRDLSVDFESVESAPAHGWGKPCPECESEMRFVEERERWFCPECREYY